MTKATCTTSLAVVTMVAALAATQSPPAAMTGDQAPRASIANDAIRAELLLPDAKTGYYQGTRFDWSGAITSLTAGGHSYFGKWFDRYDPKGHDAIMGPVEEFQTVGYDEAKIGESFVRIGVGAVRKPTEPSYGQFKAYAITDPGTRTVKKGSDWVEFAHVLGDTGGYAYDYRKRVQLKGRTLVLVHHLTNTGRKPITTNVQTGSKAPATVA